MQNLVAQRRLVFVLLMACLSSNVQAQIATSKPAQTRPTNWTDKESLPLLIAGMIKPKAEAESFNVHDQLYIEYPRVAKPYSPDRPFASDDEAVAAARKWIASHFGESPADVTLQLQRVERISADESKPLDDITGHSVQFRQVYRGIPTSRRAIFNANNRTRFSAIIELCRFEPLPDTAKPVINREAAIKAWRAVYEAQHATPEQLAEFDKGIKQAVIELRYVWSPLANRGVDGRDVYAPTWVLSESACMVDGHSGKPWYND